MTPYKIDKSKLSRVIRGKAVKALFSQFVQVGPLDDGCLITAQALQNVLGGTIHVLLGSRLADRNGIVHPLHAVLKKGDKYWDADGECSAGALVATWQADEATSITSLRKFIPGDLHGCPRCPELVDALTRYLEQTCSVSSAGKSPVELSPKTKKTISTL